MTDREFLAKLWRVYRKSAAFVQPNGKLDCVECLRPMDSHESDCEYPLMVEEAQKRGLED